MLTRQWPLIHNFLLTFSGFQHKNRDGILRERPEHARGRNLADCGRIYGSPCKSVGLIEEMRQKYSK